MKNCKNKISATLNMTGDNVWCGPSHYHGVTDKTVDHPGFFRCKITLYVCISYFNTEILYILTSKQTTNTMFDLASK